MSAQPSTPSAQPARAASDAPSAPAHAPSGRLLLRMPSELHGELARAAEREGTSLNQYITRALARTVGWGEAGHAARGAAGARAGRDTTTVVLVANAVAVGAAAVAAIAILLFALLS